MRDHDTDKGTDPYAAQAEGPEAEAKGRGANREGGGSRFNSTLLAVGVGVMLLGCLLFLDNLPDFPLGVHPMRLWPIIIVAIGVAKLVEQKCRHLSGWAITLVGALLLWHSVSEKSLGDLIGPAILICIGIFLVLHAQRRRLVRMRFMEGAMPDVALWAHRRRHWQDPPMGAQPGGEFASGTAIMSSYKYRPTDGEFCGGDVTAIFGGFEMDLSRMTMKYDTARIEVFAIFGGGEIRVPEGWSVSVRVSALGGGVDDKTIDPPSLQGRPPKTLIIAGSVMFGGVTVKTRPYSK